MYRVRGKDTTEPNAVRHYLQQYIRKPPYGVLKYALYRSHWKKKGLAQVLMYGSRNLRN